MKKKLLLLALIILPLAASAEIFYTVEIDGICYNLNTEGNIAEITQHSPCYSGDVVIPETVTYKDVVYSVTGIDFRTFMDDYELTSVSIPNSVTTIEDEAFVRCRKPTMAS